VGFAVAFSPDIESLIQALQARRNDWAGGGGDDQRSAQLARTELKYVLPFGEDSDPTTLKNRIARWLLEQGLFLDPIFLKYRPLYPWGTFNISVYFDTVDFQLTMTREIIQYNELRIQTRARTHDEEAKIVSFEVKILYPNSGRAKQRFPVRRELAWKPVQGIFDPAALLTPPGHPDYPAHLHFYENWCAIVHKFQLIPRIVTRYQREAFEPLMLAPGTTADLRLSFDNHIAYAMLTPEQMRSLNHPGVWLALDELDWRATYHNTYFPGQAFQLLEAKYVGSDLPSVLKALIAQFNLPHLLQPTSKVTDAVNQYVEDLVGAGVDYPRGLTQHGMPFLGPTSWTGYRAIFPEADVPRSEPELADLGESAEVAAGAGLLGPSQMGWRRKSGRVPTVLLLLAALPALLWTASEVHAAGTFVGQASPGGIFEFLTSIEEMTRLGMRITLKLSLQTFALVSLNTALVLLAHRITRDAGRYELSYPLSTWVASIAVAAMVMFLQGGLLLGLGVAGLVSIFRYRMGVRSHKDMVFQMIAYVFAFACAVQMGWYALFWNGLFVLGNYVLHFSGIMYGAVKQFKVILVYEYSEEAVRDIETILRNQARSGYDNGPPRTVRIDGHVQASHVISFNLNDPTRWRDFERALWAVKGMQEVVPQDQKNLTPVVGVLFPLSLAWLLADSSTAAAAGLDTYFDTSSTTFWLAAAVAVTILFYWVLLRRANRPVSVNGRNHNGTLETDSGANGRPHLSEEERQALINTRVPVPVSALSRTFLRRLILPVALIILVVVSACTTEGFGTKMKIEYVGLALPPETSSIQSPISGTVTAVFLDKADFRVSKGQKLLEVSPVEPDALLAQQATFEAGIEAQRASNEAALKAVEARQRTEQRDYQVNLLRMVQLQFNGDVLLAQLQANTSLFGFASGYLDRRIVLQAQKAASAEEVEIARSAVTKFKNLMEVARKAVAENQKQIDSAARELKRISSGVDVAAELKPFEDVRAALKIQLEQGIKLVDEKFAPRTINAAIDGMIQPVTGATMTVGLFPAVGDRIKADTPLLTITSQQAPRLGMGFGDPFVELPKQGDWIEIRESAYGKPALRVQVKDVFHNLTPVDLFTQTIGIDQLSALPRANRPRPALEAVMLQKGIPFTWEFPENYQTFAWNFVNVAYYPPNRPTLWGRIVHTLGLVDPEPAPESRPEYAQAPLEHPLATPRAVLGQYDGLSITLIDSGRKDFGRKVLDEISGGVFVREEGKIYLGDDQSNKFVVLDRQTLLEELKSSDRSRLLFIDMGGLAKMRGSRVDFEAAARRRDGKILIVDETANELHLVKDLKAPLKRDVVFSLPPPLHKVEAVVVDDRGRVFLGYGGNNHPKISEVTLDEKKRTVAIVSTRKFADNSIGAVRDMAFFDPGQGREPLIVIADDKNKKLHFRTRDGSILKNVVDLSRIGFGQVETVIDIGDSMLLVCAETKHFPVSVRNWAIVQVGRSTAAQNER
jgi:hypothetical protein